MDALSRKRFDGIELIRKGQEAAITKLDQLSQLPASAVLRDGRITALHGRFVTDAADPVEAASAFLNKHETALGFSLKKDAASFAKPGLVNCFDELFTGGITTVFFPHHSKGIPTYRGGVAVAVDEKGTVRAVSASLPSGTTKIKAGKPDKAEKAATRFLGKTKWSSVKFCVLDPAQVLGRAGRPFGVWVFDVGGDNPFQILIPDGGDQILHIVTNPGCPIGPLPIYHLNQTTGAPDFLFFPGGGLLLAESVSGNAVTVARALFERFPKLFGTAAPDDQLRLADTFSGSDPTNPITTVIFGQLWMKLPVFGCQLRVHLSQALAVRSVSGNFLRDPRVPIESKITEAKARTIAGATAQVDNFMKPGLALDMKVLKKIWNQYRPSKTGLAGAKAQTFTDAEDRGLVILPTALTRSGRNENHLAWWFRFADADRFVSAITGALVLTLSRIHSSERVFDDQQAGLATLQFVDGVPQVAAANLDPEAQRAAAALSSVSAFWRIFRRDSWDNRGSNMDVTVDSNLGLFPNAFWNGQSTVYSPSFAVLDVIGHEFTHGLTQATAGLIMLDESGAANEHYSDLFGNLIFPDVTPGDWRVGEQIPAFAPAGLRDMRNPVAPTYQNYQVRQPNDDSGGVHTNSGILNRAAVLLCDGAGAQPGIGRSRLARLAWEVLTTRLHPLATFSDVLHLTWGVAMELANSGALGAAGMPGTQGVPPAFDQTIPDTVVWAFQQVGLNLDVQAGWVNVTANTPFTGVANGSFFADVTLYPGVTLQGGRTLADMEVRLFRSENGTMRASGNRIFNATDGSYGASITEVQLGTANVQTTVRITSPTALPVSVVGVPTYQEPPAGQTPVDAPPLGTQDSGVVRHWHFGSGRRFDERLFPGGQLGEGCFVTQVELLMVDSDESTLQSTTNVGQRLGNDTRGCYIISRTLGGRSVQAEVHSWFELGNVVRYKLRYTIAGTGCGLPDFTVRDITP